MFHPCNTSLSNNRSWRPKDRKLRNTNSKNYIAVNGGRYHSCCRWHQQTIKAIILSLKPIYPRFFSSFQNNLFPFRANSNAGNIVYDKSKIMIAFYIDADGLGLKLVSYWIWLLQHLLCFIQNDWIGNIAKIISWFHYYQYHSITLLYRKLCFEF